MFAEVPPGEDWNWLRALHGSYHKWTQSSLFSWFEKATKPNNDPPKAKHVRRIILASLRDTAASPLTIANHFINSMAWRADPRIAAKALYIILILLQYQERLDVSIATITNKVVAFYNDYIPSDKSLQLFSQAATRIGSIIHSKLNFHDKYPEVHGNFALSNEKITEQPNFIADLTTHLTCTLYETVAVQSAVVNSDDFVVTVLWQSIVSETISAYRLLKTIDNTAENQKLIKDTEDLIDSLPNFPYVSTTVIFPLSGENVTIPRERFPKKI
ncbi:AGC family protein kinase [Histomonas meleagridis]|uniref:AGC family protein kinase n=1 Tax=Histomonas meleagridis TaxID=135588 RepID=UPI003559743C|nr:AGC family protein kinase [Histomonas meleagridis]KAH0799269.1 AGC family protein kinase [Histomonas meleagridis]